MSLMNKNPENASGSRSLRKIRSVKDIADFSKVGGLTHHLKTLREVIIFPLLHGNVFSYFKIKAPRGVLFYGPPGTGKTLVAGALAAEINREGIGKVSFFQRKGADILDKWVGESEKNLRNLFEKAMKSRPSIIFFDELDGLAPIRSEKNDHIHSSIVATLLALMDGLDNKPGVIVIGATNRIDSIDPALRRPGRFDRELYFPLPGVEARKEILEVHTSMWKNKPSPKFITRLSDLTAGFCGSDLQALCSEAVLCCMKRIYPHVDSKGYKIKIDADTLKVDDCDFLEARRNIVPSAHKQGQTMRNLTHTIKPLLSRQQNRILRYVHLLWPHFLQERYKYVLGDKRYAGRILLIGSNMQGLNTHLVPSLLKHLEHLPSFVYDTRLFDNIKLTHFVNVQSNCPAVILLSRIDEWWNYIDDCDQHTIVSTLEDIHAGLPILAIASCKTDIPLRLHNFFYNNNTILIRIEDPNEKERESFLAPLFFDESTLSVYKVLVSGRKYDFSGNRMIKCDNSLLRCGTRRKMVKDGRESTAINNVPVQNPTASKKRKREQSCHALQKKIKFCENKFGVIRSRSAHSLYDIHKQIKKENFTRRTRRYDSVTSFKSLKNKQHFTRVLSDLLNQRKENASRKSTAITKPVEAILCSKLVKLEPKAESCTTTMAASSTRRNLDDFHMKKIYNLWKHASLVTSKNMTVAQLELMYDVISACINIHRNCFDSLIENLEHVVMQIEQSYKITESQLQCP